EKLRGRDPAHGGRLSQAPRPSDARGRGPDADRRARRDPARLRPPPTPGDHPRRVRKLPHDAFPELRPMLAARAARESLTVTTEHVLPNDTNALGNLYGGRLLQWMDTAAAIAAHRHCRRVVVTASVNHVSFKEPIGLGSIVTLESKVSRAFS